MSIAHVPELEGLSELTDEQFKLVGKVITEWTNVEFLLKVILSRLVFTPSPLHYLYTDRMSGAGIQTAIEEAITMHIDRYSGRVLTYDTLLEIRKINEKIWKIRTYRNKLSHFCWSRFSDKELFGTSYSGSSTHTTIKYRGGREVSRKTRGRKSFASIRIEKLDSLYNKLYELIDRINQVLKKLPEIEGIDLARKAKAERIRLEGEV